MKLGFCSKRCYILNIAQGVGETMNDKTISAMCEPFNTATLNSTTKYLSYLQYLLQLQCLYNAMFSLLCVLRYWMIEK